MSERGRGHMKSINQMLIGLSLLLKSLSCLLSTGPFVIVERVEGL